MSRKLRKRVGTNEFSTTIITRMYEHAHGTGDWKLQGVQISRLQQERRLKGVDCNKKAQRGGEQENGLKGRVCTNVYVTDQFTNTQNL